MHDYVLIKGIDICESSRILEKQIKNKCKELKLNYKVVSNTKELAELEGNINSCTKIHIISHGVREINPLTNEEELYILFIGKEGEYNPENFISYIFKKLYDYSQKEEDIEQGLNVHLFSCYSGFAAKHASLLGIGSTLITHAEPEKVGYKHRDWRALNDIGRVESMIDILKGRFEGFIKAISYQPFICNLAQVTSKGVYNFTHLTPSSFDSIEREVKDSISKFAKEIASNFNIILDNEEFNKILNFEVAKEFYFHEISYKEESATIEKILIANPSLAKVIMPSGINSLFNAAIRDDKEIFDLVYNNGGRFTQLSEKIQFSAIGGLILAGISPSIIKTIILGEVGQFTPKVKNNLLKVLTYKGYFDMANILLDSYQGNIGIDAKASLIFQLFQTQNSLYLKALSVTCDNILNDQNKEGKLIEILKEDNTELVKLFMNLCKGDFIESKLLLMVNSLLYANDYRFGETLYNEYKEQLLNNEGFLNMIATEQILATLTVPLLRFNKVLNEGIIVISNSSNKKDSFIIKYAENSNLREVMNYLFQDRVKENFDLEGNLVLTVKSKYKTVDEVKAWFNRLETLSSNGIKQYKKLEDIHCVFFEDEQFTEVENVFILDIPGDTSNVSEDLGFSGEIKETV
jgi:hypothetical protein